MGVDHVRAGPFPEQDAHLPGWIPPDLRDDGAGHEQPDLTCRGELLECPPPPSAILQRLQRSGVKNDRRSDGAHDGGRRRASTTQDRSRPTARAIQSR